MAKVLLVEDSATQAVEIRMLLEEAHHDVLHVGDGQQALDALASHPIEIVVTDLQMPVMNGLELVEAMQADFEHIPSVLVTAQGSEELASKALQRGAAGYVPKLHLQTLLNDTIIDVLGVVRTDASFSKLIATLQKNVFVFDMPNDASLISPCVGLLIQVASGMQLLNARDLVRVGVAVEHAIINAMYRGNLALGPSVTPPHRAIVYDGATTPLIENRKADAAYKDRRIHIEAKASKREIQVTVRDEGKGFDITKVPARDKTQALNTETGQGLVLMQAFTDELKFNETGNEVTLVKRCQV